MLALALLLAYFLPGLCIYLYGMWWINDARSREVFSFREHTDAFLVCMLAGPLWVAFEVWEWTIYGNITIEELSTCTSNTNRTRMGR